MSVDRIIARYLTRDPACDRTPERQRSATHFEQVRKGQTEVSYGKRLLEQTLLTANAN